MLIKALKKELTESLEEDDKADKLRSLPLYSCRITSWKLYVQSVMTRSTYGLPLQIKQPELLLIEQSHQDIIANVIAAVLGLLEYR